MDVAICNKKVQFLQKQREIVAQNGPNPSNGRGKWLINAVDAATNAATMIMDESIDDNGLRSPADASTFGPDYSFRVENMTSRYGSFGSKKGTSPSRRTSKRKGTVPTVSEDCVEEGFIEAVASFASLPSDVGWSRSAESDKGTRLVTSDHLVSLCACVERNISTPPWLNIVYRILRCMLHRSGSIFPIRILDTLMSSED